MNSMPNPIPCPHCGANPGDEHDAGCSVVAPRLGIATLRSGEKVSWPHKITGKDEWQARENQRMLETIDQMRADYDVLGGKYLKEREEIEQLQQTVVAEIVALKAENNRLRLALKEIYHSSAEATVRNAAWDAAHTQS